MNKIISIHSYRGGTGKTSIALALASLLAKRDKRVAAVEGNFESPHFSSLFGNSFKAFFNDYFWGKRGLKEIAVEMPVSNSSTFFLLPAEKNLNGIVKTIREIDPIFLTHAYTDIVHELELDFLVIDNSSAVNEMSLLSLAIADISLIVLEPHQSFEDFEAYLEISKKLGVRNVYLFLNKCPTDLNKEKLLKQWGEVSGIFFLPLEAGMQEMKEPTEHFFLELEKAIDNIL